MAILMKRIPHPLKMGAIVVIASSYCGLNLRGGQSAFVFSNRVSSGAQVASRHNSAIERRQNALLGIGSWQVPEGNALLNSLSDAIHAGYRLIDTARSMGTSRCPVGIACGIPVFPGVTFFLVDKVWNAEPGGTSKTLEAFRKSTALLGTSYLDLYMIHWPATHEEPITCQAINAERGGRLRSCTATDLCARSVSATSSHTILCRSLPARKSRRW